MPVYFLKVINISIREHVQLKVEKKQQLKSAYICIGFQINLFSIIIRINVKK